MKKYNLNNKSYVNKKKFNKYKNINELEKEINEHFTEIKNNPLN